MGFWIPEVTIKMKSCSKFRAWLILMLIAIFPAGVSAGGSYSPCVDQSYPTKVYWGDTHVHTALSHDAYILGNRLMPDDAYRFAKGETVRASSGEQVRLRRPSITCGCLRSRHPAGRHMMRSSMA